MRLRADRPGIGRRRLLAAAGFGLLGAAGVRAEPLPPAPEAAAGPAPAPLGAPARALLGSQSGKAVMGARGTPLVTELVDFNASDWRRSALDMRELLAGDRGLAYAVVQAPRRGIGSVEAARVALGLLAVDPTRFEAFYEALAETEGEIDGVKALTVVRTLGIDHYKVFKASNQPDVTDSLSKAVDLAAALGMLDPPAYVIGGRVFLGPLSLARKRALIAEARACGGC